MSSRSPAPVSQSPDAEPWSPSGRDSSEQLRSLKGKERDSISPADFTSPTASSERLDAYPPTNEEDEETRRVEENLRRWEIAERQRRKAARDSIHGGNSPSLLGEVSRRASLLLNGQRTKTKSLSLSNPAANGSQVDIVPLTQSAAPMPISSARSSSEHASKDPFAHPSDSSPFADPEPSKSQLPAITIQRPTDSGQSTPSSSYSAQQPNPIRPPEPTASSKTAENNDTETRWWHEWLCGCGEGKDRGGDHQAARTNPFE